MKISNPFLVIAGLSLSLLLGCSGNSETSQLPVPTPQGEIDAFRSTMQPRINNIERQLEDLNRVIEQDTDTLNVSNLKDLLRLEIEANRLKMATSEIGGVSYATFKNRQRVLERQWTELETALEAFRLRIMQEFQHFENSVDARLDEMSLELLDVERYTRKLSATDGAYYNSAYYDGILVKLREKRANLDLQNDSLVHADTSKYTDKVLIRRRNRLITDVTDLGADIRNLISELRQTESDITQLSNPTY